MSGESPQSGKQYPRNQVYNNNYRAVFQSSSRAAEQKNITNLSGTSLADLTYSPKSSTKTASPEIAILHERIEYLQKELEMLTQLLMEEESKRSVIERFEKQNRALQENMDKTEEINSMLQTQLEKSQKDNEELVNALKSVNEELQNLRAEHQKEPNISESKSSKTKQQVQEDIIKLNDEISNVLSKLHTLNEDYQVLRDQNEKLGLEKIQMNARITELEEKLSQELNRTERYKSEYEYSREEILLLKQEIQQVNELSIQKQKQIHDEYNSKLQQSQQEYQQMKSQFENEKTKSRKQIPEDNSTLVQIKNVKIRSLEIDNEMLKRQLTAKEQQIGNSTQNMREMQRQLSAKNDAIELINEDWKSKIRAVERNYDNRITLLEEHIKDLKYIESKVSYLQEENRTQLSQLREKQQRIYELESGLRENSNKQYMIHSLEEEIKSLRSKEQAKDIEIQSMQLKRMELSDELDDVKRKLSRVQNQVKNTSQIKEKYGKELAAMKEKMKELVKLSEQQQQQIRDIESEREHSSKKKISDMSLLDTTHIHKLDDLELTNKELEKMLINQKVEKDNQNKRYKQLLQDYKQLNHQLTLQLQLYRDAKNVTHPFCPLQSSRDSREGKYYGQRSAKGKKQDWGEVTKQLEVEKNKYEDLREKHEKVLERQRGMEGKLGQLLKEQKQAQFLKIDNSSLKAQVTQLNIRIQEYKVMVENLRKEGEIRSMDAQKIRYSLQREYESKLEVQKMQIINQYNALLRARNVRIEPTEYGRSSPLKQHSAEQPQHLFHLASPSLVGTDPSKIRYHPEYKKLQQEYMRIHKQLLELEQLYKKSITQCKDQIQKLRIENEYHRKTIDQLHAEGYGLYQSNRNSRQSRENKDNTRWGEERERELEEYRNKYEEINKNYHKLYEEYVSFRNSHSHSSDAYINGGNVDKIRQLLRPSNGSQKLAEQTELAWLKKLIDDKLIELQITPREPASVIERAGWVIEKLSALVLQLRQDRDTLKNQKKQVQKQNDKLKVKLETLQYQKSHNLKELAVALEKYKYLERKHLQLSQGTSVSRQMGMENHHYNSIDIPTLNLNREKKNANEHQYPRPQQNEKDIHKHQAEIIREERLALLRKYQKDIENLEQS